MRAAYECRTHVVGSHNKSQILTWGHLVQIQQSLVQITRIQFFQYEKSLEYYSRYLSIIFFKLSVGYYRGAMVYLWAATWSVYNQPTSNLLSMKYLLLELEDVTRHCSHDRLQKIIFQIKHTSQSSKRRDIISFCRTQWTSISRYHLHDNSHVA